MKSFRLYLEARGQLYQRLMSLRPQLAAAAQKVYDAWEQDEEGMDDEYGGGGICHDIADAMVMVIDRSIPGVEATQVDYEGTGEVHVPAIAILGDEACDIDSPPGTYETGGGYTWKKMPGVRFEPNDVWISPIDLDTARGIFDYQGG